MIRLIALTDAGLRLAQRLQLSFEQQFSLQLAGEIKTEDENQQKINNTCEVWFKPQPFAPKIQQAFEQGDWLLFICATGIVIRTLAPVINNKHEDPPVLVLDELGEFVIPLLSGHQGGANQWASEVATLLGAQAVSTTAKPYLQPVYTVGMGCERHCPESELSQLLNDCLKQASLSIEQIHSINSIDLKADETGLINCAGALKKPYQVFDKDCLGSVEHLLSVKSDYVFETVGVYGVAESAALVAAQQASGDVAELVLTKIKTKKATCAIARAYPKNLKSE